MKKNAWTDADIRGVLAKAKLQRRSIWAKDPGAERGKGALEFRASPEGKGRWYWRYTLPDRSSTRIPLGTYGDRDDALTLREARQERDSKVALYIKPESKDVRAFEAEQVQAKRDGKERAALEKIAKLEADRDRLTLSVSRLLAEYVEHLEEAGKALSARDAGNMFKNHVSDAFPAFAALPALDLMPGHVVEILRRLIDGEKRTTARKLRSYLRAAYSLAIGAAHDPNSTARLDRFNVKSNPVQSVKTIKGGSVAGERTLNERELKAYIGWLESQKSPNASALLLALYSGGQRMSQLLRVNVADVDTGEQILLLEDGKGRRKTARKHAVPYSTRGRALVDDLLAQATEKEREFLFVDNPAMVASKVTQASKMVNDACNAMTANPKAFGLDSIKPFRMGDIRRTCETMLAPIVSKDIRAQLLSHGVSGVQATNYDRYAYIDEKRAAINLWESRLAEIAAGKFKAPATAKSKVTALRKTARKNA